MSDRHLTEEDLAGYLGRELGAEDRRRVEAHLAECSRCCDELVAVGPLVGGPRPDRRRWLNAGLATAAVLVGVLLVGPQLRTATDSTVLRSTDEASAVLDVDLEPIRPREDAAVDPADLRFVWHAAAPGARYTVTIADAEGVEVLRTSTYDTSLVLGPDVELIRGEPYLWEVSALLSTGETARASFRRFRIH